MSSVVTDAVESVTFKSVTIRSEKIGDREIDITEGVSNIDIYEHIDKPYLTAAITFSDSKDIIASARIGGGERIEITLESTRDGPRIEPVSKTFYLDSIITSTKLNDNTEFFVLHLIEDIGFISSLQNINKAYSDNPSQILKGISSSFLGKKLVSTENTQKKMKLIVPNLTPIEAMAWIKNMSCTTEGYPFYLLSNLVSDELSFVDLKTLLSAPVINPKIPYSYGEATMSTGAPLGTSHRRVIKGYTFKDTDNLLSLIKKGLVGADYRYLNPTNAEDNHYTFDVQKDVVDLVPETQYHYNKDYMVNGKSFNAYSSRTITQVGSTEAYNNESSYHQSAKDHYKLNTINRAIDHLIKNNPLTITVNGVDFLDGSAHHTIGRKIAVRFMRNTAPEDTDYYYDNRKSGDFLIFSAKHSFDRETYTTSLSCLKISNGDVE